MNLRKKLKYGNWITEYLIPTTSVDFHEDNLIPIFQSEENNIHLATNQISTIFSESFTTIISSITSFFGLVLSSS